MVALPRRYEPLRRLGKGGGGEVWAVRDRVDGRVLALKVLAEGAGEPEVMALVREAMALSGLEGLGVPQVVAFGTLGGKRRFMVRELVEGASLEDVLEEDAGPDWIEPLACAADQLTKLHRAGLLHGDIKPANIIVGERGRGTLVDLGLAAPWREGGTLAQGLTPKYAAPELLAGEPLTVRAEVYALGATLRDALARRGGRLRDAERLALVRVAARATEEGAPARYPSVDELASALRAAAGLAPSSGVAEEAAWPVVALEGTAAQLVREVAALAPGEALVIDGAPGSGRTTLARRLAWTLGVEGRAVAMIEAPRRDSASHEIVELELAELRTTGGAAGAVVIVDGWSSLDETGRSALRAAAESGARVVAVADLADAAAVLGVEPRRFEVPPLDARAAEELLHRAVPSLPDAVRVRLVARANGRPGRLRAMVRALAGRAIVSPEDVDAVLDERRASLPPAPMARPATLDHVDRALDMGRIDEADEALAGLGAPADDEERVRMAMARARIALGRGDAAIAARELSSVEGIAQAPARRRAWQALRARACLRRGEYAEAVRLTRAVTEVTSADATAADALSVQGVALAFTGDDDEARRVLKDAIALATSLADPRAEAVALGSSAIAHQRAGRMAEAKVAYERALAAAETARDAATVAAMRLNLAGLAQGEGDLALALAHLEAAVDMGRRAGGRLAIQQALMNLANLDLYLGRYARAGASIDSLRGQLDALSPVARAQLLGLQAELATRTGDVARGADLYEQTARAWEAQGRALDAAESRLERVLALARDQRADAGALTRELAAVGGALGGNGFGEHEAMAQLVRGVLARLSGDEESARRGLDEAYERARAAGRREWAWQALDARARLAASQGSVALARRDTEAALAMLEETASKLPRDLREVFWNDPRRRALRQAHTATLPVASPAGSGLRSQHAGQTSIFTSRPAEDRLARILEITRELAREHDMPRLLSRVTDHAVALLGAERGFVLLVNERGELLTHAARDRRGDDSHASFSRSVAEEVLKTGEPVVAMSARDDERLAQAVSVHQLMIQSIACVPIVGEGQPIGALYVETRLRPGMRFQDELPTLAAFADQAAIAIENARLISENRRRAEELSVANADLAAAHEKLSELLGRRTEQLAEARRDLKQVRAELRSHFGYAGLVGTSAAMRRVYALVDRVKDTDVPVLVTGESGTGKEVVARAIHQSSPRAKKPFIGVNCGAIPENLLETELFGSVKGAFTGADRDRNGLFREAHGGTIMLDEIGELPLKMQAGLLRVLQEKCVRPVGSAREEPVDVRMIAATNRDLEQMVASGEFREDLFYRLHVVVVRVPPVRERVEDIPPLINHFLGLFAARYRRDRKSVTREATRRLCAYPWPGNVRQLEHVLLNAWLMSEGDEIAADDLELPSALGATSETRPRAPAATPVRAATNAEFKASERERILSALTACNWNRVQAAKMIGVPRRTFYRRLKEFGIL